ncbi:hypothetical protein [Pedobacter psychrodurus]|uniref:hypothetical protein n=1 Tax=Pedobacter psychrodurus TaxID=2530456 RepID=UPI002930AB2A|nr:hypothetical protein [Pedobacter psychrodurus]
MKKLIIILIALGLSACNIHEMSTKIRNKSLVYYKEQDFATDKAANKIDSIVIDETYTLYIRAICREKPEDGFYAKKSPNKPASVVKCDCEDQSITYKKERQEIQYLLISEKNDRVIYITTIPPRVYAGMLTYQNNLFNIPNFVNINYFNTFFFGSLGNGELLFQTKNRKEARSNNQNINFKWAYHLSDKGNYLEIDRLIEQKKNYEKHLNPNEILQPAIRFYKKENYRIGLCDDEDATQLTTANNNYLENKTIYFTTCLNNGKAVINKIAFTFNESILLPKQQTVKKIYFENLRLKSAPILSIAQRKTK